MASNSPTNVNNKSNQTSKNFQLDQLRIKDNDLKGRRIVNAGNAVNQQDYTTLADVTALINKLKKENGLK